MERDGMASALDTIGTDKALQDHWFRRLIAIIVDSVIISIIAATIMLFVWFPMEILELKAAYEWSLVFPSISGILLFLYSFIMESLSGNATLGKRLMKLRVISITGDIDAGKAAIRNISKIHSLFLLIDWIVGFIQDGDPKQRFLDRVAGTTIVLTTRLTDEEMHLYQNQQAKYAPPPQEPYHPATRHEAVYQYPPQAHTQSQEASKPATEPLEKKEAVCAYCGGRMAETGGGQLKCIRCGKGQ